MKFFVYDSSGELTTEMGYLIKKNKIVSFPAGGDHISKKEDFIGATAHKFIKIEGMDSLSVFFGEIKSHISSNKSTLSIFSERDIRILLNYGDVDETEKITSLLNSGVIFWSAKVDTAILYKRLISLGARVNKI